MTPPAEAEPDEASSRLPEFNTVLAVVPHPDNAEFACGGTIARWVSEGKKVVLVTNGAQGSNDPSVEREQLIRLREQEQRESARIAGIGSSEGTPMRSLRPR